MDQARNQRQEERLEYQWPVWFAEDFKQMLSEGLMVDVSSGGMAFKCNADENCPKVGQKLAARFSIPRFEEDDSSAITSFIRTGYVLRVEKINASLCLVAIQFDEPLSLKPCEQADINIMLNKNLR
ncbi:MAG: PilZ domain-containing protein [Sedimentisphaerales bacterium]|nr:PilZ domain-containing protein [Sedimentisphaerales bacterium]